MKHWIKKLQYLVNEIREREAAQRNFLREVYNGPSYVPADYERPAYLRRHRLVGTR